MLRAASCRLLDERDLPALLRLLHADPVANVFVQSRIELAGLDPWRLGAQVWGHLRDGALVGACYAGANLVPVGGDEESVRLFADRARRSGRQCSSIVGPAGTVLALWAELEPVWGGAREVRDCQPLLATTRAPAVAPDPAVRRVRPDEVDVLLPASIAMFTEEVGVSPLVGDGGALYRSRVAELVAAGRAFARIEDGRVLFKAELGAVTAQACQVQGVWVPEDLRGRGLGHTGVAAVVAESLRSVAPVVSLYVNDFNVAARRVYERVGFARVGTFASILF